MKLYLKFFYRDNGMTRLVIEEPKLSEYGLYFDVYNIYTLNGTYNRQKISGKVDEIWENEKGEGSGQV